MKSVVEHEIILVPDDGGDWVIEGGSSCHPVGLLYFCSEGLRDYLGVPMPFLPDKFPIYDHVDTVRRVKITVTDQKPTEPPGPHTWKWQKFVVAPDGDLIYDSGADSVDTGLVPYAHAFVLGLYDPLTAIWVTWEEAKLETGDAC